MKLWVAFVIVGALLIIVATISVVWHHKQGSPKPLPGQKPVPKPTPEQKEPSGLPQVKVMMLGPRESGKTMQLVAMHHGMTIGEQDVQLSPANEETLQHLGAHVSDITGKEPVLPGGNPLGSVREWVFDVKSRGQRGADLKTIFQLTYFDYAGEHGGNVFKTEKANPSPSHDAGKDFREATRSYDIILGVIDGEKVAQAMDSLYGSGDPPDDLETDIWQTLALLTGDSSKVIHLVLTKWDELLARDYSFDKVVEFLDRYVPFRNLRTTRSAGRLRIIPVSAFGVNGYLKNESGALQKDRNQTWEPLNSSMPVACALTDIVAADLARMEQAYSGRKRSEKKLPVQTTPLLRALLYCFGLIATVTLSATGQPHLPVLVIAGQRIGWNLQVPVGDLLTALREVLSRGRKDAQDQQSPADPLLNLPGLPVSPDIKEAAAQMLSYCLKKTRELEHDFPHSDLTRSG